MAGIVLKGSCFCKAVSWSVEGPPICSRYCHCTRCQRLSSAPFIHSIHFPESAFQWTHAQPHADYLDTCNEPDKPYKCRYRCKNCGVNVAVKSTRLNRFVVWSSLMEREEDGFTVKNWEIVKPTGHIFYDTRLLDVKDGLRKWETYENESKELSE